MAEALGTAAPERPRARERGRMRRRLRTQKRMREALLMDLGALVYELHRQGRRAPELLQAKAAELAAVDQEVRGLAEALDTDVGTLAIVAAGVAGSCEHCGSLLSTDARYCSGCGNPAVPGLAGAAPSEPHLATATQRPGQLTDEQPAVEPTGGGYDEDPSAPWLADSEQRR